MTKPKHTCSHSLLLITLCIFFLHTASQNPDLAPLLSFKSSNNILNWNSSTEPCTWPGITCTNNRVTHLVLENFQLHNSFQPLTSLSQLRVLSLKHNQFSGSIPDLSNLKSLKSLFLSHNNFSGEVPASLISLTHLTRVDLSFNSLSGEIPAGQLNRLTHIMTLYLEENRFTGNISGLNVQNLENFNVSGNRLSGQIPFSLSTFPASSFSNNLMLCGPPLSACSTIRSDPTRPGSSSGAVASPLVPSSTVSSSPTIIPENGSTHIPRKDHSNRKISPLAATGIAMAVLLVLGLVFYLIYWCCWKNYAKKMSKKSVKEVEKIVYSSTSPYPPATHPDRGKMVFFNGSKRFELEDLFKASAEMLGRGGLGTAYKAILDGGNVVAVKRLKDICMNGKKDFEQQMEVLGRLNHPNLVSLKAYYLARDEKLLVYDYMPNGNLFWMLHGNRGPGRTPLDWTTRLKIASGAARGLAYIHESCNPLKLIHGNIKSTNVLIDKTGNARLTDFGFSAFALPGSARKSNGYYAPEPKVTQKSDVYSFGVLLLELLTGKCPSSVVDNDDGSGPGTGGYNGVLDLPMWVQSVVREEWTAEVFDLELMRYKDIEEEMVGLLQIAMACSSSSQDQRPQMNHVVKLIEELRGGLEMSPSHETADLVSDSPSVSDDTWQPSV